MTFSNVFITEREVLKCLTTFVDWSISLVSTFSFGFMYVAPFIWDGEAIILVT